MVAQPAMANAAVATVIAPMRFVAFFNKVKFIPDLHITVG
ncbi:protein of unknown function [Pararobbsia alpina]